MSRPLIGITGYTDQSVRPNGPGLFAVAQPYVLAVEQEGGAAVIIPPHVDLPALRVIFDHLDGLLLSGGGDIHPTYYGEDASRLLWHVDERRDRTELTLARWALADELPMLAICRGHQVLNVAAGGTLVQDIPTFFPEALTHTIVAAHPKSTIAHTVEALPDSRLAALIGDGPIGVNSAHHQAVKEVGAALIITARAPDGIIEGLEAPEHPFCLSVQWHPEVMVGDYPMMRRLFAGLTEAAAQHAAASPGTPSPHPA